MMDEEADKVIAGLRCLGGNDKWKACSDCPYHGRGKKPCRIAICEDAERMIKRTGESVTEISDAAFETFSKKAREVALASAKKNEC